MASAFGFLAFLPRLPLVQEAVPITMLGRCLTPRHEQSRVAQIAACRFLMRDTIHNYSVASNLTSTMPT